MSSTPAKSAEDARYASQDPFIQCCLIQSRLQSVLRVHSFYVERKNIEHCSVWPSIQCKKTLQTFHIPLFLSVTFEDEPSLHNIIFHSNTRKCYINMYCTKLTIPKFKSSYSSGRSEYSLVDPYKLMKQGPNNGRKPVNKSIRKLQNSHTTTIITRD